MKEHRLWFIMLEDDEGKIIATHPFETDLTDYPADEYTITRRALELYRDLLYREGLWEDYRIKKAQYQYAKALRDAENDQPR